MNPELFDKLTDIYYSVESWIEIDYSQSDLTISIKDTFKTEVFKYDDFATLKSDIETFKEGHARILKIKEKV